MSDAPRTLNITPGQRFGKRTVVRETTKPGDRRRFLYRCDCGREVETDLSSLKRYPTCGKCAPSGGQVAKHGGARDSGRLAEYRIWGSMLERCNNPTCESYQYYGARGIKLVARWRDFATFIADVGPRPSPTMILTRRNKKGNFTPRNVRWAESKLLKFTMNGETLNLAQWCRRLRLHYNTIHDRIRRRGWSIRDALTTPVRR